MLTDRVMAADGCKGGWVVVERDPNGRLSACVHASFEGVLRACLGAILCIDVPIGLMDDARHGGRECDRLARSFLDGARSSVFSPPERGVLRAESHAEAVTLNRDSSAEGIGLSIQAFSIFPKIREVDEAMTPSLQDRVFEVHPELCFRAMDGAPEALPSKKKAEGRKARRALLERAGFEAVLHLTPELKRVGVVEDDLLDACAACWTAGRIAEGTARRFPESQLLDSRGLRMEMWI